MPQRRHDARRAPGWVRGLAAAAVLLLATAGLVLADALQDLLKDALRDFDLGLPRWLALTLGLLLLAALTYAVPVLLGRVRGQPREREAPRPAGHDAASRHVLVTKLRHTYAAHLEQSLIHEVPIEPRLELLPGAVEGALDDALAGATRASRDAPGATVPEVYAAQGGVAGDGLLILGDAGVGKTTALLQLARVLTEDAAADSERAVPVYATLSTWSAGRAEFGLWLAEQLQERYGIARAVALRWLESGTLMALLDGLDEIPRPTDRAACVAALNRFRLEASLAPVVTCRREDYEALPQRLRLGTAIAIHRLDRDDVRRRLGEGSGELARLQQAAERDPELLELLRTPLLLDMAILASTGEPEAALPAQSSGREALLAAYVEQRFRLAEARAQDGGYPRERTMQWLVEVARNLTRESETVLFVEQLQVDWLRRREYAAWVEIAPFVVAGAACGAIAGLTLPDLHLAATTGLGALAGFLVPPFIGLWRDEPAAVRIRPAEQLRWSWRKARNGALIALAVVALLAGLALLESDTPLEEDLVAIAAYLLAGVGSVAIVRGLVPATVASRTAPNQGIRMSGRNGMRVGAATGAAVGMSIAAAVATIGGTISGGLAVGAMFGAYAGLAAGMLRGLAAPIQHAALRVQLWRLGQAPLRYVRWLEHAVELRLLHRGVGGGYVFIHRLLQDHFAAMGDPGDATTDPDGPRARA